MVSDVYGPLIECSSRGSNAKMLATVFTTLAILSWSCYTSAADSGECLFICNLVYDTVQHIYVVCVYRAVLPSA